MDNLARQKQDAFSRRQNVERYRRLLTTVVEEGHRRRLHDLLDEEQQKQRDAQDPEFPY
jgi:hypothetical protein